MTGPRTDRDARLAEVRSDDPAAPDERATLAERARRLATPQSVERDDASIEVITFTLSHSRFALATAYVLEVLRLTGYTPVPRTPEFVLGVTNLRGGILPIFDLRRALALQAAGITDLSRLLVLGRDGPEFALVVDRVYEVLRIQTAGLMRPDLPGDAGPSYVRAVTQDGTALLDGDAVLDDPRLYVAPPDGAKERS